MNKAATVTVKKAATMLGVCERSIRRAVASKELNAVYSGLHRDRIAGVTVESIERLKARRAATSG